MHCLNLSEWMPCWNEFGEWIDGGWRRCLWGWRQTEPTCPEPCPEFLECTKTQRITPPLSETVPLSHCPTSPACTHCPLPVPSHPQPPAPASHYPYPCPQPPAMHAREEEEIDWDAMGSKHGMPLQWLPVFCFSKIPHTIASLIIALSCLQCFCFYHKAKMLCSKRKRSVYVIACLVIDFGWLGGERKVKAALPPCPVAWPALFGKRAGKWTRNQKEETRHAQETRWWDNVCPPKRNKAKGQPNHNKMQMSFFFLLFFHCCQRKPCLFPKPQSCALEERDILRRERKRHFSISPHTCFSGEIRDDTQMREMIWQRHSCFQQRFWETCFWFVLGISHYARQNLQVWHPCMYMACWRSFNPTSTDHKKRHKSKVVGHRSEDERWEMIIFVSFSITEPVQIRTHHHLFTAQIITTLHW